MLAGTEQLLLRSPWKQQISADMEAATGRDRLALRLGFCGPERRSL
jgi:hypothetical protein